MFSLDLQGRDCIGRVWISMSCRWCWWWVRIGGAPRVQSSKLEFFEPGLLSPLLAQFLSSTMLTMHWITISTQTNLIFKTKRSRISVVSFWLHVLYLIDWSCCLWRSSSERTEKAEGEEPVGVVGVDRFFCRLWSSSMVWALIGDELPSWQIPFPCFGDVRTCVEDPLATPFPFFILESAIGME